MNTSALSLPPSRPKRVTGDAHLKFQIEPGTHAVISMQQVQEVLILPIHRLTPIPNMPAYMLGLMNRRSRVMWVVDLPQMLGLPELGANYQQYDLMIIRFGTIALGLAVQQIGNISWLSTDTIQPPPNHVAPALMPYLRGCVLRDQEVLLVLDAEIIAQTAFTAH